MRSRGRLKPGDGVGAALADVVGRHEPPADLFLAPEGTQQVVIPMRWADFGWRSLMPTGGRRAG